MKNMEDSNFGENLKKLLEENRITATALARDIGVSAKTIQEWTGAGGRFPNKPHHLRNIANYFGVTIHELLFGEPDPNGLIEQILNKTDIHSGLYEINIKKVDIAKKGIKS